MRRRNPPKRRPGFDGLQLLRVSDQHHLGLVLLGHLEHPRELARADHAGFIDDEHIVFR